MRRRQWSPIRSILGIVGGLFLVIYLVWEYELLDLSVFDYYQDVEQMADPTRNRRLDIRSALRSSLNATSDLAAKLCACPYWKHAQEELVG